MRDTVNGDGVFHPAFDMPLFAQEAIQALHKWGDPSCATFSDRKAKRIAQLLDAQVNRLVVPLFDATVPYRRMLTTIPHDQIRTQISLHLDQLYTLPAGWSHRDDYISQLTMLLASELE